MLVRRKIPQPPSLRWCRILALTLPLVLGTAGRAAAVTVSPEALYIDQRTRSATLTVHNPAAQTVDIQVAFSFGYPQSDDEGNVFLMLSDTAAAGEPSAVPWLRAFPRRLTLAPGQTQTVRVVVQPPAGTADGEYWGRVIVKSRGTTPAVEERRGDMRVQLNVETAVVAGVTYRKGEVKTGVAVRRAVAVRRDGEVRFTIDMERQGNAAYLGRVRAQLIGPTGRLVGQAQEEVAVFRKLRRSLVIRIPTGESATGYRVQYTLDTQRPDLPPGGALPAAVVTGVVPVS